AVDGATNESVALVLPLAAVLVPFRYCQSSFALPAADASTIPTQSAAFPGPPITMKLMVPPGATFGVNTATYGPATSLTVIVTTSSSARAPSEIGRAHV